MICLPCRRAGEDNKSGHGSDASILHSMCDNLDLYPASTPTWCDCAHVVTAESGEPYGCSNCDGRKCMDCVCRVMHDFCQDDCPECCDPFHCGPVADWEKELLKEGR